MAEQQIATPEALKEEDKQIQIENVKQIKPDVLVNYLHECYKNNKVPDVPTVEKFISDGVDVNYQNKLGNTAMMMAVYKEWTPVMDTLIKNGANLDIQNEKGETTLTYAIKLNKPEIAGYLLNNKASFNYQDKEGRNALDHTKKLKLHKVTALIAEKQKERALVDYLKECHLEKKQPELLEVERLLEKGANINYQNKHGNTALMLASHKNWPEITEFLIEKKANMNIKNIKGETALTMAQENYKKSAEIVDMIKEENKKSALLNYLKDCIDNKVHPIPTEVNKMIGAGADINYQDADGNNSLMVASDMRKTSYLNDSKLLFTGIALSLIEKGTKLDLQNQNKETAELLANVSGNTEITSAITKLSNKKQEQDNQLSMF